MSNIINYAIVKEKEDGRIYFEWHNKSHNDQTFSSSKVINDRCNYSSDDDTYSYNNESMSQDDILSISEYDIDYSFHNIHFVSSLLIPRRLVDKVKNIYFINMLDHKDDINKLITIFPEIVEKEVISPVLTVIDDELEVYIVDFDEGEEESLDIPLNKELIVYKFDNEEGNNLIKLDLDNIHDSDEIHSTWLLFAYAYPEYYYNLKLNSMIISFPDFNTFTDTNVIYISSIYHNNFTITDLNVNKFKIVLYGNLDHININIINCNIDKLKIYCNNIMNYNINIVNCIIRIFETDFINFTTDGKVITSDIIYNFIHDDDDDIRDEYLNKLNIDNYKHIINNNNECCNYFIILFDIDSFNDNCEFVSKKYIKSFKKINLKNSNVYCEPTTMLIESLIVNWCYSINLDYFDFNEDSFINVFSIENNKGKLNSFFRNSGEDKYSYECGQYDIDLTRISISKNIKRLFIYGKYINIIDPNNLLSNKDANIMINNIKSNPDILTNEDINNLDNIIINDNYIENRFRYEGYKKGGGNNCENLMINSELKNIKIKTHSIITNFTVNANVEKIYLSQCLIDNFTFNNSNVKELYLDNCYIKNLSGTINVDKIKINHSRLENNNFVIRNYDIKTLKINNKSSKKLFFSSEYVHTLINRNIKKLKLSNIYFLDTLDLSIIPKISLISCFIYSLITDNNNKNIILTYCIIANERSK